MTSSRAGTGGAGSSRWPSWGHRQRNCYPIHGSPTGRTPFPLACAGLLRTGALVALRWPKPASPGEWLEPAAGTALLQFVGLAAFGLLAAWGLHIARSPDVAVGLQGLALPLALAAVPVIEAGLLVQRRVPVGGQRATGTGVALAGFVALTAALAAAWPEPLAVLLVSAAAGGFLTRIAFREALPWAHAGAIPALALAAVVAFHGIVGHWGSESLAVSVRSSASGAVLAGFALTLAAVAELLARRGSHQHAAAYAMGGVAVGFAGLFLVTINGPEEPLTAALVHAMCAFGLLASNYRWRLRVVAHGGLWLVLVGSLWALHAAVPGEMARWGFVVALEALGFAGLGLLLKGPGAGATALLCRAARDVSIAAAILTPFLAGYLRAAPNSPWDTGTLFALALTGLALARLTGAPLATYLGSAAGFLGLLHLGIITWDWMPYTRAILVGSLTHASLATATAFALRRQERVFARPLRTTALLATAPAILLLLVPSADLALAWAGCAAWLGLVWLVLALVWRERGAFSAFQAAFSLAAVFLGVAWVRRRIGGPSGASNTSSQPHCTSTALGLECLAWDGLPPDEHYGTMRRPGNSGSLRRGRRNESFSPVSSCSNSCWQQWRFSPKRGLN